MTKVYLFCFFKFSKFDCQKTEFIWSSLQAIKKDPGIQKTCCGYPKVSSDPFKHIEQHIRGTTCVFGKLKCQENGFFQWQKFIKTRFLFFKFSEFECKMMKFIWSTLQAVKQDLGIQKTCFGCLKISSVLSNYDGEHFRDIPWVFGKLTYQENRLFKWQKFIKTFSNFQDSSVKWWNSYDRLYKR